MDEALFQRKKRSTKTHKGIYPKQPSPMPDFYDALAAKESEVETIREKGYGAGGTVDSLPSDSVNN